jgi:undecaprenyl-diphosphatase
VQQLRPVATGARSSHPFTAVDETGRPVFVKVLDPHRYERDWLYRLARLLAVRDVKDADALAPLGRQAEHEAVATFTARARGVRVPEVLLARGNDRGAVVAQQYLTGRPLDQLPPAELTPELLDRVWEQVALLHRARIAHRDLVAASVVVDDRGRPWLVDFGNGETGADDRALAGDVAELMASLSLRADVPAVVVAAIGRLGPDAVAAALPELAPLALSSTTREALRSRPAGITPLRAEVRRRLELPDPSRLQFGPAGPLAWLTIGAAAVVVLGGLAWLTGLAGVAETVEANGWRWLGGAVALAVLARGALAAAAEMAVDRRLAPGRVFAATVAVDGALLRRGPVDRRRVAARFLERSGVLPAAAERAVDRYDAGAVLAGIVAAVGAIVLALLDGVLVDWRAPAAPLGTVLLGVAGFLLVGLGQALAARHGGPAAPSPLHRRLLGLPDRGWRDDGPLDLRRWAAQLVWTAVGIALEASALAAVLHGVEGGIPVLTTVAVYAVLRLVWAALPVLGAPGLAEAGLLLALTAAGAPLAAAGAAVLAVRVLVFWLPAVLGWALSERLEHRMLL